MPITGGNRNADFLEFSFSGITDKNHLLGQTPFYGEPVFDDFSGFFEGDPPSDGPFFFTWETQQADDAKKGNH